MGKAWELPLGLLHYRGISSRTALITVHSIIFIIILFFGRVACGILVARAGIKPAPAALEEGVFTTGPPGKPQKVNFI